MFQLDDNFLQELGLGGLPEEQKKPFLQHIYVQLQDRVGMQLSEGMSDAQLEEFESIIDKKMEVIDPWIAQYAPAYQSDELALKIQASMSQAVGATVPLESPELKAEYAATKWLEVNRPDYRDVVARTLEALKQEIIGSRDAILGSQS